MVATRSEDICMHVDMTRLRLSSAAVVRRSSACVAALALLLLPVLAVAETGQRDDKDGKEKGVRRPSITLKTSPVMAFSPARIVVTAELRGGSEMDADLYCPAVEWDWGDGTRSEVNEDCAPFEPGESEIKRRWTTSHTFTMGGQYRVVLRLKRDGRTVVSGNTTVQVRPGARDGFQQP
jgi:hypothetical protein